MKDLTLPPEPNRPRPAEFLAALIAAVTLATWGHLSIPDVIALLSAVGALLRSMLD